MYMCHGETRPFSYSWTLLGSLIQEECCLVSGTLPGQAWRPRTIITCSFWVSLADLAGSYSCPLGGYLLAQACTSQSSACIISHHVKHTKEIAQVTQYSALSFSWALRWAGLPRSDLKPGHQLDVCSMIWNPRMQLFYCVSCNTISKDPDSSELRYWFNYPKLAEHSLCEGHTKGLSNSKQELPEV